MKKISKGYFLDKLFRISDSIQAQMANIFIRNNVYILKLELLPDKERELWKSLHKKSNRVCGMITRIINEKP
jgi:hypothetical protein